MRSNIYSHTARFDKYPENDLSEYQRPNAPDEFPNMFPDF